MSLFLIAYALIGAIVLGWLLNERGQDRDGAPAHILILMPALWLPVLLGVALLVLWAVVATAWERRFY